MPLKKHSCFHELLRKTMCYVGEIEISIIILAELRSNTSKIDIDVQIVVEVYPLPTFTLKT